MIPRGAFGTVTHRALMGRINRKLRHEGSFLRTARREENSIGWYFIVDSNNCIEQTHVDPVEFGRDLGVLRTWERVST